MRNDKIIMYILSAAVLAVVFALALFFYEKPISSGRDPEKAALLLNGCSGIKDQDQRYNCYAKALRDGVHQYGLEGASLAFKKYVESAEGALLRGGTCHALGHDIGQAAIMAGYTNEQILTSCSEICQEGCFNGVGHAHLALNQGSYDIDAFCNPGTVNVDRKRLLACYHGFGHGITDVFGIDLKKNLKLCDSIRDNEGRFQCGHAIFMVLSTVPPESINSQTVSEDMESFCESLDSVYQNSCFVFTGYLTFANSKNAGEAFNACSAVPEDFKVDCTERIGEAIAIIYPSDAEKAKDYCAGTTDKTQFNLCIRGAARTFAVGSNSTVSDSFTVCGNSDAGYAESCYKTLGVTLEVYLGKDDRLKYCKDFGGKFAGACLDI